MNDFVQKNRLIELEHSPLGKDVLLLTAFSGQEEISSLFHHQLEFLSTKHDITAKDLVGQPVTFSIKRGQDEKRYFSGIVSRFSTSGINIQDMRLYQAEVVPWLWLLTRTADCRIFQNQSIPQIIETVLGDFGFDDYEIKEVKGDHKPWDYCVQYRETAYDFLARLMAQEGIFYWFRHEDDKHVLVMADHNDACKDLPEKEVEYAAGGQSTLFADHISEWEHRYEFLPGRWTQIDYNFEMPSTSLKASEPTLVAIPDMKSYEIFEYPGQYMQRADGDDLTKLRMEEEEVAHDIVTAASTCSSFSPGGKFTLSRHECAEEKKTYLVTTITHSVSDTTYMAGSDAGEAYTNKFTCIPADIPYRPSRQLSKPVIQGPQTAVVVGPSGEEIYTDKYGRVKVQFHWDRYGKKNEKSSCFVRVSYPWAGQAWGGIAIPRIGQEVIIEFLEGNPDRPIITGRVYNAEQMPPYDLPANKTQSGMKSRSSQGGSGANYNEIRFEDKKGAEQLLVHAEKNQDIEVENDESHWVGHDRSKTIDNDETSHIKHNRTETVDNDESITIGNNRSEQVGVDETIGIGSNRSETVGANETVAVTQNQDLSVGQNRSRSVGQNETVTVTLTRTHSVGINEMINVGGAQEITIGGLQALTVGITRAVTVGTSQSVNIGTSLSENIGTNMSLDVGSNLSESVGKNHSEKVADNRSATVGKDDALKVGKNLVIDAGESIVIKTGKASIAMKDDGTIAIEGVNITIDGSGEINEKAKKNIIMKGQKILQN